MRDVGLTDGLTPSDDLLTGDHTSGGFVVADGAGYPARVLLVGKRARVLDELGQALRDEGMQVREDTDVDRVKSAINGASIDVVAVGRTIKGAKRDDLVMTLRAQNPQVKVVDGLAPITPLLVAQIREALTSPGRDTRIIGDAAYEDADNRVVLVLRRSADVGVTLHRLDPLYRAHETPIYVGPLPRGRQHLPLLQKKLGRGERFLVVRADAETSVHAVG